MTNRDTQTPNDPRGKPVFNVQVKGHVLEVFEAPESEGYGFVGYCDGERSVAATRGDIALRGLQKKHIDGLPETEVVDLDTVRLARRAHGTFSTKPPKS